MGNEEFTPDFFDEASKAWRANKRKKGEAFIYQCQHEHKSGKLCKRDVHWHHGNIELICKYHFFEKIKEEKKRHKATPIQQVEECSPDSP